MNRIALRLGVLAMVCVGSLSMAAEPAPWQVGQHCEITTKATPTGWASVSSKTYLGTVAEANAEDVVLKDVSVMQRVESRTPVLHRIPYVNRLFKNVGIGQTHLGDRRVTVSRNEIDTVREVAADEFEKKAASAKTGFIERD